MVHMQSGRGDSCCTALVRPPVLLLLTCCTACTCSQMILTGRGTDYAAATDEGVAEFTATLPDTALSRVLKHATRISSITNYRRTENFRRCVQQAVANLEHTALCTVLV